MDEGYKFNAWNVAGLRNIIKRKRVAKALWREGVHVGNPFESSGTEIIAANI